MNESNYFILSHYKLHPTERDKRLQFLADTLSTLRQYQNGELKPQKRISVERLIKAYSYLIEKIGEK